MLPLEPFDGLPMTVIQPADALARAIQAGFIASLANSERRTEPYRHWVLRDVLPPEAAEAIFALPVARPENLVFDGRRETNNASRTYFDAEARRRYAPARALAEAFQSPDAVAAIERECGANLADSCLRVEYCQDTEGFWLEPHTDIGVKRFTMSLFLCRGAGASDMGTDIYTTDKTWFGRAPSEFNTAMIFIPSKITFHGFAKRPMPSLRKSLIINYVGPEWRNRQELAYPDTPVRGAA